MHDYRIAVYYVFGAACIISGIETFPLRSLDLFAEVIQDVDDVVSIIEQREHIGENNDTLMGIVTHPLITLWNTDATSHAALTQLWQTCRVQGLAEIAPTDWEELSSRLLEQAVPVTIAKIHHDAQAAIALCPPLYQPVMQRIVTLFVKRVEKAQLVQS